jgi:hypothetical protein
MYVCMYVHICISHQMDTKRVSIQSNMQSRVLAYCFNVSACNVIGVVARSFLEFFLSFFKKSQWWSASTSVWPPKLCLQYFCKKSLLQFRPFWIGKSRNVFFYNPTNTSIGWLLWIVQRKKTQTRSSWGWNFALVFIVCLNSLRNVSFEKLP